MSSILLSADAGKEFRQAPSASQRAGLLLRGDVMPGTPDNPSVWPEESLVQPSPLQHIPSVATDATIVPLAPDAREPKVCPLCQGSGEGIFQGFKDCYPCNGKGIVWPPEVT